MTATWVWDRIWWQQPQTDLSPSWGQSQTIQLPLDEALQRLIVRTNYVCYLDAHRDGGFIRPGVGDVLLRIDFQYGQGTSETLHMHSHPLIWDLGWATVNMESSDLYWTGHVPPFEIDMTVRRGAAVELQHQAQITVYENFSGYSFADGIMWPNWETHGEVQWLTSKPAGLRTIAA